MPQEDQQRRVLLWSPAEDACLRANAALADLGLQLQPEGERITEEAYLDTNDWRLHRAGVACRLLTGPDGARLSLEALAPDDEWIIPPDDLVERLPEPPPELPGRLPGERLAGMLLPLVGRKRIDARLRLSRERRCYEGERVAAEVDLVTAEKLGAYVEVSLSAAPDAASRLESVADNLSAAAGLERAEGPPALRALRAAGITPPALREGDDLTLRPGDRFEDAAYRVLGRHLGRVLWNEPGTRLGIAPECLHDMRVATRRLRAALRVFRQSLPARRVQALRRDLQWLGDALGRVRDLDVYLIRLERDAREVAPSLAPALDFHRDQLLAERVKARAAMMRALDSRRYARFIERFQRFLSAGPPKYPGAPRAAERVTIAARRIMRARLKRVLRDGRLIGPDSPDAELHRLRIRCKRLRYACEFFSDLCGKAASEFAARVEGLQDVLGAHQDAVVAGETLGRFARDISPPPGRRREVYMALGHLTAQHAQRGAAARGEFARAWKRFDRKRVRRPLRNQLRRLGRGP